MKWRGRLTKQADSDEVSGLRAELEKAKAERDLATDTIDRIVDVLVAYARERDEQGDPLAKMVA